MPFFGDLISGAGSAVGWAANSTVSVGGIVTSAVFKVEGAVIGGAVGLVDKKAGDDFSKAASECATAAYGGARYGGDWISAGVQKATDVNGNLQASSFGDGDLMIVLCDAHHWIVVLERPEGWYVWHYGTFGVKCGKRDKLFYNEWKRLVAAHTNMPGGFDIVDGCKGKNITVEKLEKQALDLEKYSGFRGSSYGLLGNNCHKFASELLSRVQ